MAETKNLKLYTTPSDDTTTPLKEWVQKIAGETESNMTIIDEKYKKLEDDIAGVSEQVGDQLQEQLSGIMSRVEAEETATAEMKAAIVEKIAEESAARDLAITTAISGEVASRNEAIDDATKSLKVAVEESIQPTLETLSTRTGVAEGNIDGLSDRLSDAEIAINDLSANQGSGGLSFSSLLYDDEHKLHILDEDGADVVEPIVIECGTGGGDTIVSEYTVRMVNTMGTKTVTAGLGNGCDIRYRFTSIDNSTGDPTGECFAQYDLCTYDMFGAEQWETIKTGDVIEQGDKVYSVSADNLPAEGEYKIKITVRDIYDNAKFLEWKIVVKAISLTSNLDDSEILYDPIPFKYTPVGRDLTKTIKFEIDGEVFDSRTTTQSNVELNYTLNPAVIEAYWRTELKKTWSMHGAHEFKMWVESTVSGATIASKPETHSIVWVDKSSTDIIVSIKDFPEMQQYTPVEIPFLVYDPLNDPAPTVFMVDDVEYSSRNANRVLQTFPYTPTEAGEHIISITCGNVVEKRVVNIKDSGITLNEHITGMIWKFDPSGRSNADVNRDEWSNGGVSMDIPSDFRWSRGGWKVDQDGYPCFVVPAGNTVSFNANLFGTDWKSTGHNFKIIFKTANVCDYDAEVASCMQKDEHGKQYGLGFNITAQNATFKSAYQTVSAPLCEDKFTELEWNVTSTKEYCEIITWIQGVPSAVKLYDPDGDVFVQNNPQPITIGSNDCDVYIYKIREYNTSLSDDAIFNNWVMDAPTGQEMYSRYKRNDVVDSNGDLNPTVLATVHPDLRVIMLTCSHLSNGKEDSDWVDGCTVQHIMMRDSKKHSWTATGVKHRLQGTSSLNYKSSGCNLDFDFSNTQFVFNDAEDEDKKTRSDVYSMTDDSIGVNYFNLKVNIASSENANNACLTNEYQRLNPYWRDARKEDPRVRDTMEFHPCVIFIKDLSGQLFGDTEFHFYGGGDFGNSKKNKKAQGLDEQNPNECIVEIMGHEDRIQKWKEPHYTYEQWRDGEILDFRFKNKVKTEEEQKDLFHRVSFWVASTDATAASNEPLPEPVVYREGVKQLIPNGGEVGRVEWHTPAGGVTYTTDSAEYRLSKFRNEFDDYFISDSIMYYYLFTERYLMVDSRAKNSFWHTSDGIHWDHCFDYDNDTALGCNNTGNLILTYGMEDTSKNGDTPVYSCHDSVLFCNVRDCFHDRLKDVFNLVEQGKRRDSHLDTNSVDNPYGVKGWDFKRLIAEMDAYQAIKPERVWIKDMRRKYLRLVEETDMADPEDKKEVLGRLEMLNGKKTLQRAQFETYQGPYCASKYVSTNSRLEHITLRINPTNKGENIKLTVTPYCDMYINVQFVNMWQQVKAKKGVPITVSAAPTWEGASHADTYIYGASKIQELSDLADMKFGYCELNNVAKLQKLIVSPYDESGEYENVNLTGITVTNSPLLKRLSVCGCPNLTSISLAQSYLLEEVDLRQTRVAGITFARGGYLKSAKLPATVSGLFARDMSDLTELTMEGTGNLERLWIENCPGLNSSDGNLGPLIGILESCLSISDDQKKLRGVKLIGVDWIVNRSGIMVQLAKLGSIDNQYVVSGESEITGKLYVDGMSPSRYSYLSDRYPGLEVTYNEDNVLPDYTVTFCNRHEEDTPFDVQIVEAGYSAEDPTARAINRIIPIKESTPVFRYEFTQWEIPFSSVNRDLVVYAEYDEIRRQYTVTWKQGVETLDEDIVDAEGSVLYTGSKIPTMLNSVWTGFDSVAENVLSDLTIKATFETLSMPEKPESFDSYEYVYSDDPSDYPDKACYTLGEFVWIINSGNTATYFPDMMTDVPARIKLVNTRTDILADETIVLSLHSTGHYMLENRSGLAKTTWYMDGVLWQSRVMSGEESNEGGYCDSELDKWLSSIIYPALPYHWRAIIKPVELLANAGSPNYKVDLENPAIRYLYIPSTAEIGYETGAATYNAEVASEANEIAFSRYNGYASRVKKNNNNADTAQYYWTRSAETGSTTKYKHVSSNGYDGSTDASRDRFVCFGFSI